VDKSSADESTEDDSINLADRPQLPHPRAHTEMAGNWNDERAGLRRTSVSRGFAGLEFTGVAAVIRRSICQLTESYYTIKTLLFKAPFLRKKGWRDRSL
jgi:hypothetical protein